MKTYIKFRPISTKKQECNHLYDTLTTVHTGNTTIEIQECVHCGKPHTIIKDRSNNYELANN
jgi:Zn ribbon nucleic-acid-binding protein